MRPAGRRRGCGRTVLDNPPPGQGVQLAASRVVRPAISTSDPLERTQPLLCLGLGYVEGVTHGYIHHGTTTLIAALDVATVVGNYSTHKHARVKRERGCQRGAGSIVVARMLKMPFTSPNARRLARRS